MQNIFLFFLILGLCYLLIQYSTREIQGEQQYEQQIPVAIETEVNKMTNVICVGRKTSPDRVRCIKLGDNLMFPSYSSDFKWRVSDNGKYVIVSDSKYLPQAVEIHIDKAVYTGHQCWGMNNNNAITDELFAYHLSNFGD
jgi:hypothetical protein